MRKNLFVFLALIIPFFTIAQTTNSSSTPDIPLDEEGQIRYIEVVKEPGTQKELFKRCVKWINSQYKNPAVVTPTRDMVNGKIVIRHNFRIQNTLESGTKVNAGDVMYNMTIRFKEGRYRVEMTDFVVKKTSKFPCERWLDQNDSAFNPGYAAQLNVFAFELLESLKQGIKPEKQYKEEDW
ncbi:MAG: hypothetical protein B7C24_15160 [Bacteroidetes bacterium 4572_77]|nr:MAG: hypothetical protein B7C24_15160 [Bacteroidetes bacterium 4572_77]